MNRYDNMAQTALEQADRGRRVIVWSKDPRRASAALTRALWLRRSLVRRVLGIPPRERGELRAVVRKYAEDRVTLVSGRDALRGMAADTVLLDMPYPTLLDDAAIVTVASPSRMVVIW